MFPSAVALVLAALYTLALTVRRGRKGGVTNWCVGWFAVLIVYLIMAPIMFSARSVAKRSAVQVMIRLESTALSIYTDEADGRFPPADGWRTRIAEYRRDSTSTSPFRAAFRPSLAGKPVPEDQSEWMLVTVLDDRPSPMADDPAKVPDDDWDGFSINALATVEGQTDRKSAEELRALIRKG